ncbi:MAG TPA: hypothetical protein VGW34_01600 [Allosphingosinicella sp.]|nr:hypothetical protein [Allosphingosinicella sp.]
MTKRVEPRRVATALGAMLLAGAAGPAATAFPPARPVVPYVERGDVGCHWTMHDPSEKWIRGGIGQGDEDPVIDFVDSAFDSWSDSEDHRIEISVGDPARRVPAIGWAGNAGGQTPGSIGFYAGPELRKLIGGATSLQVWKDGKPVFNAALSGTPTTTQLDACVRPPSNPDETDEE